MKIPSFITKREVVSLIGVAASVLVPKLLFPEVYLVEEVSEVEEPEDDVEPEDAEEPQDPTESNEPNNQ